MSIQRALLLLLALALLAGLVPAGIVLDRRLASALTAKAREDLALAPRLLADRESMSSDGLSMHAKDLASTPGLEDAFSRADRARAVGLIESARSYAGEQSVLVGPDGEVWWGPAPPLHLIDAARRGASPVETELQDGALRKFAIAPVILRGEWVGAAAVMAPRDLAWAGTLSGLTRSEVLVLTSLGEVTASTPAAPGQLVVDSAQAWCGDGEVHESRTSAGQRYLVACASLDDVGAVAFVRDLDSELAVMPQLRSVAAFAALSALALALALGAVAAAILARPVRSLAARLEEVEAANAELAERQRRLSALQAELIRRDRLATSGRLVTELAHEVRNPVANVRNCLEVIRRRVAGDDTSSQFADMAIDELLRMHELAERMLDLNRPRDPDISSCDGARVAHEVADLVQAGAADRRLQVSVSGADRAPVEIPPDALKQVLLNIVQNAREAVEGRGRIDIAIEHTGSLAVIDVLDDGPGIPDEILERLFDPFFTTKSKVHGVGLGLFVAEGIVRASGGRITAANRESGDGARFRVELAVSEVSGEARPDDSAGMEVKT
jgi:signal transduction histidine kinase